MAFHPRHAHANALHGDPLILPAAAPIYPPLTSGIRPIHTSQTHSTPLPTTGKTETATGAVVPTLDISSSTHAHLESDSSSTLVFIQGQSYAANPSVSSSKPTASIRLLKTIASSPTLGHHALPNIRPEPSTSNSNGNHRNAYARQRAEDRQYARAIFTTSRQLGGQGPAHARVMLPDEEDDLNSTIMTAMPAERVHGRLCSNSGDRLPRPVDSYKLASTLSPVTKPHSAFVKKLAAGLPSSSLDAPPIQLTPIRKQRNPNTALKPRDSKTNDVSNGGGYQEGAQPRLRRKRGNVELRSCTNNSTTSAQTTVRQPRLKPVTGRITSNGSGGGEVRTAFREAQANEVAQEKGDRESYHLRPGISKRSVPREARHEVFVNRADAE